VTEHRDGSSAGRFLFVACRPGSEAALKHDVAQRHRGLRFAFSRPGFVTFRAERAPTDDFASAFARTWGWSLGKVRGADEHELANAARSMLAERAPHEAIGHLHAWPRIRPLPGDDEFHPATEQPARTAVELIGATWPSGRAPPLLNRHAAAGNLVLDCCLVEPSEWWLGWHRAGSPETRWPGGAPSLSIPARVISRAYFKMVEALLWSELAVVAGDRWAEIGSAPGGACQALLDLGCTVTGVDPAEMDPLVLANPRFTHVRARAKDAKRGALRDCRWLAVDVNAAPKYTLDTAEAVVTEPGARVEGLVLTLKLTDAAYAAELPKFEQRVRSWGYADVRTRQLAFNRQEVCVVATKPSASHDRPAAPQRAPG
jgi:23S rRNA (cytidine2498-2'-O)-methyltransferase